MKGHAGWARRWSAAELRAALALARDAEQAMKGGADAEAAFLDWVIATVGRPAS